jgi:lipopolysaccharide export system permease protein
MLFHSSVRQELSRYFWATLVVLTTIVITVWLIRTFGDASIGRFNPKDVGLVLGYTTLSNLHSLLTLSIYIAIVSTVSRMYADSEMVIWQGSGLSIYALFKPTMRFAWPWLIAITVLSLTAWPWANEQIQEMRERYEKRGDLERIKPGQFQESANGKRVFFIDNSSVSDKNANRIFIVSNDAGTQSIVTAQTGQIETRDQDRFLVLKNGQRIDIAPDKNELKVVEFETHSSRVSTVPIALSTDEAQSMQPADLWANPTNVNLGELGWRIGMAIAAINLLILALGIPFINPRSGRSGSLVLTIISFFTYYNMVNMSRNWIGAGQISFIGMLTALHLPVFLLACLILYWRQQQGLIFNKGRTPAPLSKGARP